MKPQLIMTISRSPSTVARVRRALSVVKKRSGNHEHTIREFQLTAQGIQVGPPLIEFEGIFSGTPRYTGDTKPLLSEGKHGA